MTNKTTAEPPPVLSVGQLTSIIQEMLETTFPSVWVAGEASDVSRPRSGHIYFTLKDEEAQIRAVVWRGAAARLSFEIEEGMQLICEGELDVYPPRGNYQLIVRKAEPQGVGAMQLALRQLQQKLAAEGLFDPERKKPLPSLPDHVAFVTSVTGAAIRDFVEVIRRRWPALHVTVVPTRVQGESAAAEIAAGIEKAHLLEPLPDLIVVGRGGGSIEDLWCFNDERVVRAIVASRLPVVSAVGHEIDVTLSDLAADLRALTPTEAAERIVPDQKTVYESLDRTRQRISARLRRKAESARQRLDQLRGRRGLRRPIERLRELSQKLDQWENRAARAVGQRMVMARNEIDQHARRLETLSPLAVLGRGYSITRLEGSTAPLLDSRIVAEGDRISTRLAKGELISRVEEVGGEE